jgi:tryptophan-rich sensory protein
MEKKKVLTILRLVLSIVVCQLAGVIGSIFTTPAIPEWYASLNKPGFTPPSWLFGPVWITLYLLMGIALFLVLIKGPGNKNYRTALVLFFIQLALNMVWSILFFGLKSTLAGLIDITILWILILTTIIVFYRISKAGSFLLIPYIIWVSVASVLNFSIWKLN